MALVSVLMTGLAMFSDMGIAASVVQNRRGDDPVFLDTAWTLQILRGFVLWCFAALFADAMATVYSAPELRRIILVAGLTAVISGFNSISLLRLRRHLEIRKLAIIDILGQAITAAATISWAWQQPSVWALVWGGLVGCVAKMLISHLACRDHPPRLAWDRASRQQLFAFGKWIFLSTILFFLAGQADRLIFGRLLSVSALGVFSIAATLSAIPTQIVWQIGHSVVFPALSQRNASRDRLGRAYRRALMPLLTLGVLPVACLAAGARPLIEILYDPRYADAGWMLQILAVAAWIQIPQASSGAAVLAVGQPRWLVLANGLKFLAMIVLLPVGVHAFGAAGAIAGLAGAELFRYAVLTTALRHLGLPGLGADLALTLLAVVLSFAGLSAGGWLEGQGAGAMARLAGAIAVIVLIWIPSSAWILRAELPGAIAGIRRRLAPAGQVGA